MNPTTQIISILIVLSALIPQSRASGSYFNEEVLVQLRGQVIQNEDKKQQGQRASKNFICEYQLIVRTKIVDLNMICNAASMQSNADYQSVVYNWEMKLTEQIQKQSYKVHYFSLADSKQSNSKNRVNEIRSQAKLGVQWKYKLEINFKPKNLNESTENGVYVLAIQGEQTIHQLVVGYLSIIFVVVSLLIVPPYRQYYNYMFGINIFSALISILLLINAIIYISVLAGIYAQTVHSLKWPAEPTLVTFFVMLCIPLLVLHLYYKISIFYNQLKIRYDRKLRARNILLGLCFIVLVIGVYKLAYLHKDVSTYGLYASGNIYYMSTFFICASSMRKYYFSFRFVLFDVCTMLFLGISSKYYTIIFYQIPNMYRLVAFLLIISVVLIYGIISYILINVVKRDSRRTKMNLQQQIDLQIMRNNDSSKIVADSAESGPKNEGGGSDWKKMKQESMMSEVQNVSVIISKHQQNNGL